MTSLRKLFEPLSPYLNARKLEFLRCGVLNLHRDMPDDGFFADVADQLADRTEALRVCAPAFAADGVDEFGCPRKRKPAPEERVKAKDKPAPDGGSACEGPVLEEDDLGDLFLPDDEDETVPAAEQDGDGPVEGPFAKRRALRAGLRDFWRHTEGLEPLRKNLAAVLDRQIAGLAAAARRDSIRPRIGELRRLLGLSKLETDLLVFMYLFYMDECDWFRGISTDPFPTPRGHIAFVRIASAVLGVKAEAVRTVLSGDAPLLRYGLVNEDDFALSRRVCRHFAGTGKGDLRSAFYKPIETEALPWDFFPAETREHGEVITSLALAERGDRGLDVLLHGVAGAGKTSFARALADRLGMRPVAVAIDETENEGPRREIRIGQGAQAAYRLGAIAVAERQCNPAHDLLIIDESDALLCSVGANRLNRILDGSRFVRLWLGNLEPGELPESNLRRFDYAVRFDPLGARERATIWRNCAAKAGLGDALSDEDLTDFAERYPVSAGIADRVCRNLAAVRPDRRGGASAKEFAEKLLSSHAKLLGVKARSAVEPKRVSAGFVLDGLSVKGDVPPADVLAAAKEHLRRLAEGDEGDGAALRDPPRLNVLLSGPPGCGKTEFVKWLGEQLGRKVVTLGASDLKDKFVGETEKRIARAFKDAEKDGAVLFFDEVDSFLRSRSGAMHSWEVSETNELLARLEDFKGLFVAATNYPSSLDPAVLRRFTFKLAFGYLDAAGKRNFFQRFFGDPLTDEEAAELDAIPDLCPGDFRTVRQRLDYLPGGRSNARRLAALREESDRKAALPPGEDFERTAPRRLGFGA